MHDLLARLLQSCFSVYLSLRLMLYEVSLISPARRSLIIEDPVSSLQQITFIDLHRSLSPTVLFRRIEAFGPPPPRLIFFAPRQSVSRFVCCPRSSFFFGASGSFPSQVSSIVCLAAGFACLLNLRHQLRSSAVYNRHVFWSSAGVFVAWMDSFFC